jgi:tetraacyldisaccharide 4'-kinase
MSWLDRIWGSRRHPLALALLPLATLYCGVVRLRTLSYCTDLLRHWRLPAPVIVVGNLTVGGTGKTPLAIWLARHLTAQGWRPGLLTRGYGGAARDWPRWVTPRDDPAQVGDEAVLLARHSGCPVLAGPERVAAGRLLVERGCNLLLSDDGLQHYALDRNLEILVVDGVRRFGNGFCLPAGPLREPPERARRAGLTLVNGPAAADELSMTLEPGLAVNLRDPERRQPLEAFRGTPCTAVAGIGHPGRFFRLLRDRGLDFRERPFRDHHPFRPGDLPAAGTVLMTEKDAVKCEGFARDDWWYVPVEAQPAAAFVDRLDRLMRGWKRDG